MENTNVQKRISDKSILFTQNFFQMKTTLTHLLAISCVLYMVNSANAQSEPVLTLVTSLNPQGAGQLVFMPNGDLELEYWDKDLIEIQLYVEDASFSRQQLKALVPCGFYKVDSRLDGDKLFIFMPNQTKEVKINGLLVNNSIKFRMKMPKDILLKYETTNKITIVKA